MNERYLFKAKDEITKEWIYGSYCYAEKLDKTGYEHLIIEQSADGKSHRVIPETVMQCTSMKDKNEKLIFAGDILKLIDENNNCILYVVVWNKSLLSWQVQDITNYTKNNYFGFDELCQYGDTKNIGNICDMEEY